MQTQRRLIALSVACLLAGCTTAYQPDGLSGGYSDRMLAANTAQVTFRGNRLTSPDAVHSYLLRRCAELTLQDGYNYFVVVHEEEPNEANTDTLGSKVTTATIEMSAGKPQSDPRAYDANFTLRKLLAEEGESQEPPTPVAAGASEALPPPIPGAREASGSIVNASVASSAGSHTLAPNPNPNALTNQPLDFNRW
jgi:hypothetical protein